MAFNLRHIMAFVMCIVYGQSEIHFVYRGLYINALLSIIVQRLLYKYFLIVDTSVYSYHL